MFNSNKINCKFNEQYMGLTLTKNSKPSLNRLQLIRMSENPDRNKKNKKMMFTVYFVL
jgi:hypothetical protein